jgi:hypothetical protein|tara:strand:- start:261 stop:1058 length:798 start_codon:yes stop_codon:yes gene_type:complete
LQREKNELTTTFKTKKVEYSSMKKSLEVDMLQYSTLMKEGAESGQTDEDALAHLLSQIEIKRQNLLNDREELKRIQRDLKENDERQTEERAEMAAQKTLIQQDKQLRSQIAEEERKKFLKEKQSYLDDVLNKERTRLQAQAEAEVAELKKSFRRGTGISAREKELEMQAVQDGADREVMMLEIQALKKHHQSEKRGQDQLFNSWIMEHQSESKKMIQELMIAFEEEMSGMRNRCTEAENMLESATRDLEYLMEENEQLRGRLEHK